MNTSDNSKSIAIVSGKGGSGKTILAAVSALEFDRFTNATVLVDGDLGTAGLSLYLGLELVSNTAFGLGDLADLGGSNAAIEKMALNRDLATSPDAYSSALRKVKGSQHLLFMSAGDPRRLQGGMPQPLLESRFEEVVRVLKNMGEVVIFDCRGGIDPESLAICKAVDDIILVVETDTTSYQATQRLVEVLTENYLARKLKGFFINKVFDDPTVIARNGTSAFKCQYLAAIPLDFDAMRDFFVGDIPSPKSVFGIHVQHGLHKAYPEVVPPPEGRVLSFPDYKDIALQSPDSYRGGVIASLLIILAAFVIASYFWSVDLIVTRKDRLMLLAPIAVMVALGLAGSLSNTRSSLGRLISIFLTNFLTPPRPKS